MTVNCQIVKEDLPKAWQASLVRYDLQAVDIGRSVAGVARLRSTSGEALFVKYQPEDIPTELAELAGEAARLRWLKGQGVLCPQVRDVVTEGGHTWMLTSGLPGCDLVSNPSLSAGEIIDIAAKALKDLHELDPVLCPFDARLDVKLDEAAARVKAGCVDETDFDEERLGRRASDLYQELIAQKPEHESLVVAHGDACLPNLLAEGGVFTGFVDCGRLGVADKAQDIALAARSIHHNLGVEWAAEFLSRFGSAPDDELLGFYRLLDEFF